MALWVQIYLTTNKHILSSSIIPRITVPSKIIFTVAQGRWLYAIL